MSWYHNGNFVKLAYRGEKREALLSGILRQTEKGFVYLDVSNDVIHGLFQLIDEEGVEKPPYFGEGEIGAHVSVMSKDETEEIDIDELGKPFKFRLGPLITVEPEGWEEMERVWFVEIDAPSLSTLREKYGLPSTYKGLRHNFHITVGVRPVSV